MSLVFKSKTAYTNYLRTEKFRPQIFTSNKKDLYTRLQKNNIK